MARIPAKPITAPQGHNISGDPVHIPPDKAAALNNLLFDWTGKLRAQWQLVDVIPGDLDAPIYSAFYYYSVHPYNDSTLIVKPDLSQPTGFPAALWGFAYANLTAPYIQQIITKGFPFIPPYPTQIAGNPTGYGVPTPYYYPVYIPNSGVFVPAVRSRSSMFGSELIIAANGVPLSNAPTNMPTPGNYRFFQTYEQSFDGQLSPAYAYVGGTLFPLGNSPPAYTTLWTAITAGAGSPGMTGGTYYVGLTAVDEQGRESELEYLGGGAFPGTPLTVTAGDTIVVTATSAIPPIGIFSYNVYVQVPGDASQFFQVNAGTPLLPGDTFTVQATDSEIQQGNVGPQPGQNTIANPASQIILYKQRIVMNDLTNPSAIQISGTNNPTQFSQVTYLATDGAYLVIDDNQGNPIMGFAEMPGGAGLLIFRRQSIHVLWGDTAADFVLRPVTNSIGCRSTDSIVMAGTIGVFFLAMDGFRYVDPLLNVSNVISQDIVGQIQTYQAESPELLDSVYGGWDGQRYIVSFGQVQEAYDTLVGGWGSFTAGSDLGYGSNLAAGITTGVPGGPCFG